MMLENLRNKQSPFREFGRTARALGCASGVWPGEVAAYHCMYVGKLSSFEGINLEDGDLTHG